MSDSDSNSARVERKKSGWVRLHVDVRPETMEQLEELVMNYDYDIKNAHDRADGFRAVIAAAIEVMLGNVDRQEDVKHSQQKKMLVSEIIYRQRNGASDKEIVDWLQSSKRLKGRDNKLGRKGTDWTVDEVRKFKSKYRRMKFPTAYIGP